MTDAATGLLPSQAPDVSTTYCGIARNTPSVHSPSGQGAGLGRDREGYARPKVRIPGTIQRLWWMNLFGIGVPGGGGSWWLAG